MREFIKFFNNLNITKPTYKNIELIQPYIDQYFKSHQYSTSRFSLLDLLTQEKYHYVIIEDTLIYLNLSIYKRKKGGSVTLYCAPINLNGDIKKEKDIIDYFHNHGVNVIISEEDMNRYDFKDWKYLSTFDDYIVSSEKLLDLQGKKFKHFRWRLNQYKTYLSSGEISEILSINDKLNDDDIKSTVTLIKKWMKKCIDGGNRVWEDPTAYPKIFGKALYKLDRFQYFHINDKDNNNLVYELTEKMTGEQILSTTGYRDYDFNFLPEANELILLRGIHHWYNRLGNHFLLNLGYCGFNSKIKKQKLKYAPVKVLKHYKLESDTSKILKKFDKFDHLLKMKTKLLNKRVKSNWKK